MYIYLLPSFYALFITGVISLIVFIIGLRNINKLHIHSICMFGILIGVHGLLHLGMEATYNYNPIQYVFKS